MDGLAMDPDRFRQLDGLLQSALQLSPSPLEVFRRELSVSDPGLELTLRSLLWDARPATSSSGRLSKPLAVTRP
jgi:hypothetical protein